MKNIDITPRGIALEMGVKIPAIKKKQKETALAIELREDEEWEDDTEDYEG